jgi:hypothetical protein
MTDIRRGRLDGVATTCACLLGAATALACGSSGGPGDPIGGASLPPDGSSPTREGPYALPPPGDSRDASAGAMNSASGTFTIGLPSQSRVCLQQALPPDGDAGQAFCGFVYALPAGDSCAAHPGLVARNSDVVLYAELGEELDPSTVVLCVLPQLPPSAWVSGSCAASTEAGWCAGSTEGAAGCAAVIQISAAFMQPAGGKPILACGDPIASTTAATDAAF